MPRNRFVDPKVDRIDISEGDWIEIKHELTMAEKRRLEGAPMTSARALDTTPEIGLDWSQYSIAKLVTWLVDWSFTDSDGRSRECNRQAIEALDDDTAQEISEAIDRHVEAQEASKKASKKAMLATSGDSELRQTS